MGSIRSRPTSRQRADADPIHARQGFRFPCPNRNGVVESRHRGAGCRHGASVHLDAPPSLPMKPPTAKPSLLDQLRAQSERPCSAEEGRDAAPGRGSAAGHRPPALAGVPLAGRGAAPPRGHPARRSPTRSASTRSWRSRHRTSTAASSPTAGAHSRGLELLEHVEVFYRLAKDGEIVLKVPPGAALRGRGTAARGEPPVSLPDRDGPQPRRSARACSG